MILEDNNLLVKEKVKTRVGESAPVLTFDIRTYDVVDSTNDELKRLIQKGKAEAGTVIFAASQTQGHGRYGREWTSPKGNLYLSFLLKPTEFVRFVPQISFVTAVAMGEVVAELLPETVTLGYKWPNDLLLNGKKFAGILLESSLAASGDKVDWLIVGLGLNITRHPENLPVHATSLAAEDADLLTDERMRDRVLARFAEYYSLWQREGFAPIRDAWLKRAALRGEKLSVRTSGDEYEGVFEDINRNGELVLVLPDGRRRLVSAGEVFFAK
ncbi:MAG: biotin--[acetyl-CoA-carboxylase] ligase [Rickettsiales bacterium]|jgi:BirA family biotin operon repressor/biotin-[acetyl-CoA-carboxylase] ligase|nr:biotin--[acetyl-CoA-carboxylase] ligase [Rickettsiales bacterium]